jgi:methylthioribose-1-phosphate isomerase
VYADETRPYLQGARLTAFELHRDNIPVTVVTDSMAGYLMQQKMVDLVIVGADRIAANGDTANKIGTYSLAVLAKHHGIPFYVAAPMSTLDYEMASGAEIEIEQRSSDEVVFIGGKRMVPEGVPALHPAFDVTPHDLITAIITDKGVVEGPNTETMAKLK